VVLLWSFYSAQVFLLGAEFTNIYATRRGSRQAPGKLLRPWRLIIVAIADCAEHDVSRGFPRGGQDEEACQET